MHFVFHAGFHDSFNKTRNLGVVFDIRKFFAGSGLSHINYRMSMTKIQNFRVPDFFELPS